MENGFNIEWRITRECKIRRGIFQRDNLSPLFFILCMIPLSITLRKANAGYELKEKKHKINLLLFMDDLKLYGKSRDQIDSLVRTVHPFSTDIRIEFSIKKCAVLILKRGKVVGCDGIILSDNKIMKQMDEDGYKYLGIMECNQVIENEMKTIFRKEYIRRVKLVPK